MNTNDLKFAVIVHEHRFGNSIFIVPYEKWTNANSDVEFAEAHDIDFEPEREECLILEYSFTINDLLSGGC